jgi:hypothetical protein
MNPIDMGSMRAELSVRRQQEATSAPRASTGKADDDSTGVFQLTFVNPGGNDDEGEDEGGIEHPQLAEAAVSSPGNSALAARLEAELQAQQAGALRILKARVRPWRTVNTRAPQTAGVGGSAGEAALPTQNPPSPLFRPRLPVHTKAHVLSGGSRRARPRPPAPTPPSFLTIGAVKVPDRKASAGADDCALFGEAADFKKDEPIPDNDRGESFEYDGRLSRLVRIVKERNELGWHRKEGLGAVVKAAREAMRR